jgi:hypothetical protein
MPNGGWQKASLRIMIALLRCGAVKIVNDPSSS